MKLHISIRSAKGICRCENKPEIDPGYTLKYSGSMDKFLNPMNMRVLEKLVCLCCIQPTDLEPSPQGSFFVRV